MAIVQDREGQWFVRRIDFSVHDGDRNAMVYHCDKHLAGPFPEVHDAADWVAAKEALEAHTN